MKGKGNRGKVRGKGLKKYFQGRHSLSGGHGGLGELVDNEGSESGVQEGHSCGSQSGEWCGSLGRSCEGVNSQPRDGSWSH